MPLTTECFYVFEVSDAFGAFKAFKACQVLKASNVLFTRLKLSECARFLKPSGLLRL